MTIGMPQIQHLSQMPIHAGDNLQIITDIIEVNKEVKSTGLTDPSLTGLC